MKRNHSTFVSSLLILALGIFGCQNPSEPTSEIRSSAKTSPSFAKAENTVVTLWAGQTINVGTVTVNDDGATLSVTYTTTGSWNITETHLDISTQEFTERGAPGKYLYKASHSSGTTTYTYSIPVTWNEGTTIYIRAHAEVKSNKKSESAFGGTIVKPKKGSWYGSFSYSFEEGPPPPPPVTYSVSGIIFLDENFNGSKDDGEEGLAGVTVWLNNVTNISTDIDGSYSFTGLTNGSYTVGTLFQKGYYTLSPLSVDVTIAGSDQAADFRFSSTEP